MDYLKIPLEKQFSQVSKGMCVHPEYAPLTIRAWASMPIAAYLGLGSGGRREAFRRLLGITEEEENAMTYAEAAGLVGSWLDDGRLMPRAHQALRLLSEPMYDAYQTYLKWKEQKNEKNIS